MADPTKYTPGYDFSNYQATNPADPLPGTSLDTELDSISDKIGEAVDAIKDVRRSDGSLKNGVVTRESLADELAIGTNVWTEWATSTAYVAGDAVTKADSVYRCLVAHTSGTFSTDLAASKWRLLLTAPTGNTGPTGATGATGPQGDAATITVGTVTTLAAGSSATITNSGTSSEAVFDFAIPRGDTGAAGAGTGDMLAATYDPTTVGGDAFDMDNMVEGTNKILTAAERTKLGYISVTQAVDLDSTEIYAIYGFNAYAWGDHSTAGYLDSSDIGTNVQAYSSVLQNTTASFTTALETKLSGIATGATANSADSTLMREYIVVAVGDETTALTTGTNKTVFRMPCAMTLTGVRASLTYAQTSGSILTIDINQNGATLLSTKLTIDNNETTSTTAATAAVIGTSALTDDAQITIDIDQVGTPPAGLKVTLIGYRS